MRHRELGLFGLLWLGAVSAAAAQDGAVHIVGPSWEAKVDPATLHVEAVLPDGSVVELARPVGDLGRVSSQQLSGATLSFSLGKFNAAVTMRFEGDDLLVAFESEKTGELDWPTFAPGQSAQGYILPLSEGTFAPLNDLEWREFLAEQPPRPVTTLSLPLWAVAYPDRTVTCIVTHPFNTMVVFELEGTTLLLKQSHEFTSNWETKPYSVRFHIAGPSPIEPAQHYRRVLEAQGRFVSMRSKIDRLPDAERLLGAPHAYIWGDALLSRHDIRDWSALATKLREGGASQEVTVAGVIWGKLNSDARKAAMEMSQIDSPYAFIQSELADGLARLLTDPQLFADINEPADDAEPQTDAEALTDAEVAQRNAQVLIDAMPGHFGPYEQWGNGVSTKLLDQLHEAGFERFLLCLEGLEGANARPHVVQHAVQLGYLIAPSDSYHVVHPPDTPADTTWPAAQFDQQLYETGGIVTAQRRFSTDDDQMGYHLSPIAARPYVEQRVDRLLAIAPFNAWLVEDDAMGELFDDYSSFHLATQLDDMNARLQRLRWLSEQRGLVVGSTGGAAYAAPAIHFAHGVMTPVIGKDDDDMSDRASEFYVGGRWPPDGPRVYVQQVPLKTRYAKLYLDPRYRLPLYQAALHDSVVTTHDPLNASLKFQEHVRTVAMLEQLYNVPPLYHLNLDEFETHAESMLLHYEFFTRVHREAALLPMTAFAWMTPDRLVQRVVYGDRIELIANFSDQPFVHEQHTIGPNQVAARWLDTGERIIFRAGRIE